MEPETVERPIREQQNNLRRTARSRVWSLTLVTMILIIILLIFILQNSKTVQVSFLMFHGNLPLGIALLLAAVIGGLLVGVAGLARILELRHIAKDHKNQENSTTDQPLT